MLPEITDLTHPEKPTYLESINNLTRILADTAP